MKSLKNNKTQYGMLENQQICTLIHFISGSGWDGVNFLQSSLYGAVF